VSLVARNLWIASAARVVGLTGRLLRFGLPSRVRPEFRSAGNRGSVAGRGGAVHDPPVAGPVPRTAAVQHRPVVPHHEAPPAPRVTQHVGGFGGQVEQLLPEPSPLVDRHAHDLAHVRPDEKAFRPLTGFVRTRACRTAGTWARCSAVRRPGATKPREYSRARQRARRSADGSRCPADRRPPACWRTRSPRRPAGPRAPTGRRRGSGPA